jgi:hypothetical protein
MPGSVLSVGRLWSCQRVRAYAKAPNASPGLPVGTTGSLSEAFASSHSYLFAGSAGGAGDTGVAGGFMRSMGTVRVLWPLELGWVELRAHGLSGAK